MFALTSLLKTDGIAPLSGMFRGQVDELVDHLKLGQCANDHVFDRGKQHDQVSNVWGNPDWPILGLQNEWVLMAPHYLEWALGFYDIAAEYFNDEPLIYSTSGFITQPSPHHYRDTHDWHRDRDNPRMLAAFLYGTRVEALEDGAHLYEVGSHSDADGGENYNGYYPTRPIKTMLGPAGSAFVTNPFGIHMATRPTTHPRVLLWARWLPASGVPDGVQGSVPRAEIEHVFPQNERLQRALRLIVR